MSAPSEEAIMAVREGDVVLVRGTVARPDAPRSTENNIGVVFNHAGCRTTIHYVRASAIVSIEARPFAAGDRVSMPNRSNGVVVHVGDERAFVRWTVAATPWRGEYVEETATLLTHLERMA